MPFSEDDLRSALRRKEPPADFTAKVMARLGERPSGKTPAIRGKKGFPWLHWPVTVRWATAGALAAMLVVAIGLYQYQHNQEQARAERARQQTILALQITTQKLDHVFQRASRMPEQNPARDSDNTIKEQL